MRGWGCPRDLGKDLLREDCLSGPTTLVWLEEEGGGGGREEDLLKGRIKDRMGLVGEERRRRGRGGEVGGRPGPRVGNLNELRQVCQTQPGSQRFHIIGLQPMSPGVGGVGGAGWFPGRGPAGELWAWCCPDFKNSPSKMPGFHQSWQTRAWVKAIRVHSPPLPTGLPAQGALLGLTASPQGGRP